MNFSDLGLGDEILRAVADAGYKTPTPIQEKAIPYVLMGRDILGCAQTGTGKTASFTLPMLDILHNGRAKARMPRSLILEPTRELAAQVADNFDTYGKYQKLSKALLIGGESMSEQIKALDGGVDVLIATPGRLLDLFERGRLLLNDVKLLVIDEADRMLDMGFIPDVERIVSLLPKIRTTLMFSATMPKEIRRLADKFLMNPKEITVAAPSSAAATITQGLYLLPRGSAQKEKRAALRKLIAMDNAKNGIIFCNRKRDVNIVYRSMLNHGFKVGQLHGDMAQPDRMETLNRFKSDELRFLVCSDVAARGLDIPDMSHVFNFDVPTHAEDYVHRIGRTGRAGRQGSAYTIALAEDRKYIASIEKLLGMPIPPIDVKDPGEGKRADNVKRSDVKRSDVKRSDAKQAVAQKPAPDKPAPDKPATKHVNTAANNKPVEKAEKREKNKPQSRKYRSPQDEVKSMPDVQVKGMGEFTPAFLTRPVVLPKDDIKPKAKTTKTKAKTVSKSRKSAETKEKATKSSSDKVKSNPESHSADNPELTT